MKTVEVRFKPNDKAWLIYGNEIMVAPVVEVKLNKTGIEYWFWWSDFVARRDSFDLDIHSENSFKVNSSLLFESREDLINSL